MEVQELPSQRTDETHSKLVKTEEMLLPGGSGVVSQKGRTDFTEVQEGQESPSSPDQEMSTGDSGYGTPGEYDISMAVPSSWSQVSKENANFLKLYKLIIDGGTRVLREVFDSIHPPRSLLDPTSHGILQNLRRKRILTQDAWNKLYPAAGSYTVDSKNFDITLLCSLFRTICHLPTPAGGWDKFPAPTNTNPEDDIVRIRMYRNMLLSHPKEAALSDSEFNKYWNDVSQVLIRLGGIPYQAEIDELRAGSLQPKEMLDIYRVVKSLKQHEMKTTKQEQHEDKESEAENLLETKLPTETK